MAAQHLRHAERHAAIHSGFRTAAAAPLPDSYDCTNLCTPVKNQGQCGSCHDSATEVLTEKGWVAWPEYNWITPLGTMNPASGFLEFQVPIVKHIYDHDGPMYFYDGRSLDFALTPNHRMVWGRNKGSWKKSAISNMPQYADIPHATVGWKGTELKRLGIADRTYDGDDLLALVAHVISCGHVGHQDDGNGGRNKITFSCFRDERIEQVRSLAYRLDIPEQTSRPGVWYFRDAELAEWFRQNAYDGRGFKAGHKRVPMLVKCASQRQIEHFLSAFGDQHRQSYGGRRFYSGSRLMIDDLQELLLRIGKRGTIEEYPPREHGTFHGTLPELMLTERKRDSLCVEKENTRTDHYKGKVYCATVPNGTLVTRRNKLVLISSNCWDFSGTCMVEAANIFTTTLPDNSAASQLSEQYTLDQCDGSNGGCGGDNNTTVLQDAKTGGLPLTSVYGPYTANEGSCKLPRARIKTTPGVGLLYTISDWGYVGTQAGVPATELIKAAMLQYGPIGVAIAADNAFERWGDSGPNDATFPGSGARDIDHDVVLVGWDEVRRAWKLRNSWGPDWCNGGYIWIAYGANLVGYEAVWCTAGTPVPRPPPPPPPPPTAEAGSDAHPPRDGLGALPRQPWHFSRPVDEADSCRLAPVGDSRGPPDPVGTAGRTDAA
jgi:C1A family cysteine protease